MKTVVKSEKLYEAMFLVDSAQAAADWDGVNKAVRVVLERAGAEIVSIRRWDERKLAYDIKGRSRGTYILCYFRVDGGKIQTIERDAQLSERIMRVLVLNVEHMSQEDIEKDTPATKEKAKAEQAKEPEELEASEVSSEMDEGESELPEQDTSEKGFESRLSGNEEGPKETDAEESS